MVVAAAGRIRGAVAGNAHVQRNHQALQGGQEARRAGGEEAARRYGAEPHCISLCMRALPQRSLFENKHAHK